MAQGLVRLMLPLLGGCALGPLMTQRASWPDRRPAEPVPAPVSARVDIHRDAAGIPHIRARTESDAMFALGYVHAQDRLFQMDLSRRFAFGALSEVAGDSVADLDVAMRLLDVRGRARVALDAAAPETQALLEAYAAGVNAWITEQPRLPVEHRIVGATVAPWSPEDSLSLIFANAWLLATNPAQELAALALRDELSSEQLTALVGTNPPVDAYWPDLAGVTFGAMHPGFVALFDALPDEPAASNNWAVAPSRTSDGGAWLASDPHLLQRVPSLWYVADVRGGDLHVAGATLPGAPMVVIGHNGSVAWGLTNLMADNMDFALVERVGERGYRLGGVDEVLEEVVIQRPGKRGAVVAETLFRTKIGPVVTALEGDHLLVLRWHALSVEDHTADLFAAVARAETVDEVVEATKRPTIIAQQMATADDRGHIGLVPLGSIVARVGFSGRVPYPASREGFDWGPFVDPPPPTLDPDVGWIASANSLPAGPDPHLVSTAFEPPWREARIREVLGAAKGVDFAQMRALQLDRADGQARAALPSMLDGVEARSAASEVCLELLQGWDGVAEPWSVGATVYYTFERALAQQVLGPTVGDELPHARRLTDVTTRFTEGALDPFLSRSKQETVQRALEATCTSLADDLGDDPGGWAWGTVHRLHLEHPFASASKLLSGWSMDDVPYGGSGNTVNAAGFPSSGPFDTTWMASMRLIVPLADPGAAQIMHPGGQSGHPREPSSRDLYRPFTEGAYVPLYFDDPDVLANATQTTVLEPTE